MVHDELLLRVEQYRRILRREPAWEGVTWVMELIRIKPRLAIDVLDAYITAHCQALDRPYWLERLYDATSLIRAKYIDVAHPRELLLELGGEKFERLVRYLYEEMGYDASLTQSSHDDGVDIRALKNDDGEQATVLIQCKCVSSTVGVGVVRELHGTIENEKASKGVLVATSKFSPAAIKWARENPRLELIDHERLFRMLNEHLWSTWTARIDWFCQPRRIGPH